MRNSSKNYILFYLIKFIGVFLVAYFGTIAVIGLSAPGGYYSRIVDRYLDYISWLRASLLHTSKAFLSFCGFDAYVPDKYVLKLKAGHAVTIVYSCLGYGVMSFWIAFIVANTGSWKKKLKWITGGLFLIWVINILRISLLLIAINRHFEIPLFDHHTWFTIFAYLLIFILIYFYDKSGESTVGCLEVTRSRLGRNTQ